MAQYTSVRIEYLGFGNETDIFSVGIDNRQIPCVGAVECFHNVFHTLVDFNFCRRYAHEFAHIHLVVQVGTEHNVADVVEQDNAKQSAVLVCDREKVAVLVDDVTGELDEENKVRFFETIADADQQFYTFTEFPSLAFFADAEEIPVNRVILRGGREND